MTSLLRALLWAVSGIIGTLTAAGIGLEWIGKRLIPLQKFLTNSLKRRVDQ